MGINGDGLSDWINARVRFWMVGKVGCSSACSANE
jgi:hypothetical protein